MTDVTVIGLGQMGMRLVELLSRAGKSVTVWNIAMPPRPRH